MTRLDVSDRAVLRWLERVEGVDVGAIRRRIGKAAHRAAKEGASGVQVGGVTFRALRRARAVGPVVVPVVVTTHSMRPRIHLAQPRRRGATE